MGYTHYWYLRRDADPEKVAEAGRAIAAVVRRGAAGAGLAGSDGTGEPDLREDGYVRFNGVGPDLDHETFCWPPDLDDPQDFRGDPRSPRHLEVFDFCKTAAKPYDVVVVASLIAAKRVLGDALRISSDGGNEAFEDAYAKSLALGSS